jgi:hypothetical protein
VEPNLSRAVGHSEEIRHLVLRHVGPIAREQQPTVGLRELRESAADVDGEGHVGVGRRRGGLPCFTTTDGARSRASEGRLS